MAKVDIFSGFLGAGKTTLIKKLIEEAYQGEQVVLIENEFGEIGVDGGFLKDTGVQINEMAAGCICCSLVGDFGRALNQVIEQYKPDRILIEPSGVGKLSDVIIAVQDLHNDEIQLNGFTTVVDAKKCKMYMNNFGEFFDNQIEHASSIILSHVDGISEKRLDECVAMLRKHNTEASIVTTPWDQITGKQILAIMEQKQTLSAELDRLRQEAYEEEAAHAAEHEHEHHHHHDHDEEHEHDHEHEHHHHHDHDEDEHEHHHHHDHEEEEHEHEHHHHHHHHHGHAADEVFDDLGVETTHKFTEEQIRSALNSLQNIAEVGQVLRAKGIVEGEDGAWIHFDYVPGEPDVRTGAAGTTGMICVIGVGLDHDRIRELFGL
ncbi:MAG: GTP-binding protein [Eubacterium sp.]|nr:GTP-binding protein [Eubacterium sp.]